MKKVIDRLLKDHTSNYEMHCKVIEMIAYCVEHRSEKTKLIQRLRYRAAKLNLENTGIMMAVERLVHVR